MPSTTENNKNNFEKISNKKLGIAIGISIIAIIGIWWLRFFYWENPTVFFVVNWSFALSFTFLLGSIAIGIGKNFETVYCKCYKSVKRIVIEKVLDYNLEGKYPIKYIHFISVSLLINFLVVAIIAVSVLNPSMQTGLLDLSSIPIVGDFLNKFTPWVADYNVPLIMWFRQEFFYMILFSLIGPTTLFFFRQIRHLEYLKDSDKYPGARVLFGFFVIAPLIIASALPQSDPPFFWTNLSLAASLLIIVGPMTVLMIFVELLFSKLK